MQTLIQGECRKIKNELLFITSFASWLFYTYTTCHPRTSVKGQHLINIQDRLCTCFTTAVSSGVAAIFRERAHDSAALELGGASLLGRSEGDCLIRKETLTHRLWLNFPRHFIAAHRLADYARAWVGALLLDAVLQFAPIFLCIRLHTAIEPAGIDICLCARGVGSSRARNQFRQIKCSGKREV